MSIPTHPEASPIEKFPHVQQRVCMLWGTEELDAYLNHLLTDSRNGQRRGFPVEVTSEFLFLAELDKLIRAIDLSRKMKISLREAYQKVEKKDRGIELGDFSDPLSCRDRFSRAEKELGVSSPRTDNSNDREKPGLFVALGKGVFSLFTNKAVLFLVVLLVVYQFVLPLFIK